MADPWDWHDDAFKLDAESPLEMTRRLWTEISHSEEDSRSLFSSPLADITSQDPSLYSMRGHDSEISKNRFCYGGVQGGSPRMKRRRLLFCESDLDYESCDPQSEADSVLDSFTNCVDPSLEGCNSGMLQSIDVNPLPSDTFWYRACDEMPTAFGAVAERGSHEWVANSPEDAQNNDSIEEMRISLPVWSEGQLAREDVVQGPATPLPGKSSLSSFKGSETRKQLSPPSTPYPKFSAPVVYPFTLLKPSETAGDITLKDINQRISMPPLRPVPQLHALDDSWPSSPTDSGLGLSGKSIVARTKIHTEGNGTITIMRTRG